MNYVAGNTVVQFWTVLNESSNPLTGMSRPAGPGDGTGTNIQIWLHRQSGSVMVAATETITWTEIGTTGHYSVSFTPANTGLYVLQLEEVNVNTLQRFYRFPDLAVISAGSVFTPAFANAFCAETDIERWLQQPLTATTKPSSTEAAGFAEERAASLMSLCARLGLTITPATVTVASRLEDMLRKANAVGAAFDCRASQAFGTGTAKDTESLDRLSAIWTQMVGSQDDKKAPGHITGEIEMEIGGNLVSLATDHILSGDTLAAPAGSQPTDAGIQVGMGDVY